MPKKREESRKLKFIGFVFGGSSSSEEGVGKRDGGISAQRVTKRRVTTREALDLADRMQGMVILTGGDATRMDGILRIRVLAESISMMVCI